MYTLPRLQKHALTDILNQNRGTDIVFCSVHETCTGCAQDIFLHFMSYLTLVDTILKLRKMNRCIIDTPEI